MSQDGEKELKRSLEHTLAFAHGSGAWLADLSLEPGPASDTDAPDLPILSQPGGGRLAAIREELGECKRCRLHQGRTHIVFGVGSQEADVVFVGEGPGEQEDLRGEPFVGRAGQLLDRMMAAIGLDRKSVYIANVVKCRPPGNRDPREDEVASCKPFLQKQLEAIGPRVVCALGSHAAKNVTGLEEPVGKLRGRVIDAMGARVVVTYHPAYLLRNPSAKKQAWEDLKLLRSLTTSDD